MLFSHNPLRSLLGIAAFAAATGSAENIDNSHLPYNSRAASTIKWGPCSETERPPPVKGAPDVPFECANLSVPLDYSSPDSRETFHLELLKAPAPKQPAKGSILYNPGGPGLGKMSFAPAIASIYLRLAGNQYDIITFDPRGVGNTLPFECFENDFDLQTYANEAPSNSSDVQVGRLWGSAGVASNSCLKNANETISLINTPFVARDMMSIVDALGEDGMLRYWGLSYGTTLGATVAAMFPDRIDKLILDGVMNPHEYYHSLADFEEWTFSDKGFSGIFSACVDARDNCTLAKGTNATAEELERSVWDLLDAVKERPIAIGSYLVDYAAVKGLILQSLYDTASWPGLSAVLAMALTDTLTEDVVADLSPPFTPEAGNQIAALMGIRCVDRTARASSLDEFLPVVERLGETSRIYGDATVALNMQCARWKIEPKERFEGDFQVKTKNPILLLSNTYDSHTPIISARNVSSGFEDSVVLEINGYGHGSHTLPSKCTLDAVSAYWRDGTLPDPDTVCKVDAPPYSGITWGDILAEVDGKEGSDKRSHYAPRRWLL